MNNVHYFEVCMARRSDNTRKELKEMAILAGLSLLEESGIEGLSARKIATRIGYTVGTLYNVFTDLEDIVLHINMETVRAMCESLAPLAGKKKKPRARIRDFAHCYGDYARTNSARWNLLHTYPRSTPLPTWFHDDIQEIFALVEQPLLELNDGDKKAARTSAKVLWAGLHGICALSLSQKLDSVEAGPLREMIDDFVGNYLAGAAR